MGFIFIHIKFLLRLSLPHSVGPSSIVHEAVENPGQAVNSSLYRVAPGDWQHFSLQSKRPFISCRCVSAVTFQAAFPA